MKKALIRIHLRTLVVLSFVSVLVALPLPSSVSADTAADSWFSEVTESVNGAFTVRLDSNSPVASLNAFQNWLLTVTDSQTGEAVSPARISVAGGMPMHGHGLPTQPQVTEYLGEGRYRVEGVKFNMHGQWMLEFQITTAQTVDTAVFEVIVDY